ncbi:MAG TPA: hypothetical protein VGK32_17030 [Vicinamibacterales bacterium]|jgi:hypothetical protein
MRIAKDGHTIASIEDWHRYAPPKRNIHWAEGHSAFELARAWCGTGTAAMPDDLRALFDSRDNTRGLSVDLVTPEHRIVFDAHGGEPRNADLAFVGRTATTTVAVTIEAKADEPFGATVAQTMTDALERLITTPASHGVMRVADLVQAILPVRGKDQPKVGDLRYQLLTAVAGSLAYARENQADLAVLIIHQFVTSKTRDTKHAKNEQDYRAFVNRLTGVLPEAHDTTPRLGLFAVPGAPLFASGSRLLIGKIVTNCRPAPTTTPSH